MKILIVDDEKLIRDVIKEYLLKESFEVLEAENGEEAINICNNHSIDLMILDIMMPKMDGYTAYKTIRESKKIPTIILSARSEEYDKLLGFDLGVDDFLAKPFSPKELVARVKAVTRRNNNEDNQIKNFIYQKLKVDFMGRVIIIDEKEIKVTPKEFDLLAYFIKNKNIAISRETLLNKIWGYDFYGDDRTVDTHIKMLRNSLGEYRDLIITVRGVGYKFETK